MKNTVSELKINKIGVSGILENISFTFYSDKIYSIFGRSGSGKSTLLKAISGNIPFDGDIYLDGESVSEMKPEKHRVLINYLPQEPVLTGKTVKDSFDVLKKLKVHKGLGIDFEYLEKIAADLKLKNGIFLQPVNQLSGGEKQRIALIRSLILRPRFILLDEPTSALDVYNEDIIFKFLEHIKGDIGIIIVTHSRNIILNSDVKILMDKNGIKAFEDIVDEEFIFNIIKDRNEN